MNISVNYRVNTMTKETICYNPATGEEIGRSELHTGEELNTIIKQAESAQKVWEKYPLKKRIKMIIRIRDYIVTNADLLAEVISSDNGKTRLEALATEILPAAMAVSFYCKGAGKFLKDKRIKGGNIFLLNKRSKLVRVPFGVVGIISPWNYPFAIPFSEVIMGLLAGNSIILKTASETQMVGLELKKAIEYAGLPEGVFNYINLPGRIAGDTFLESGIDKLFFTGSVQVGKYLLEKSAATLTPLCLELGGNDAMIVCDDADIERAASGALWAGFQNCGQSCGGVERIYVDEKIYNQFLSALKNKIEKLVVTKNDCYRTQFGCMTTTRQIDTVQEHIQDALNKGAKVYAQSGIPENTGANFLPATVLVDVNHDMMVMKDETFGPVVGVMKFNSIEEAIKLANDSYLGLTGSVWSGSQHKAEKIARCIKAGVVTINDHLMSHGLAETPWGGFKQSGIGRTHGELGFDEMTQTQVIVKDLLSFTSKQLWWHPYSKNVYDGLKGLLNLLYNSKPGVRIKGFIKLIRIVPRIFSKE